MGTINDKHSKSEKKHEDCISIAEDPRSLKSCLRKFGFDRLLQDLDDNLEDVRRHRISEDVHKVMIKDFNKKLLKLSLHHHPDRFRSEAEQIEAHHNQTTINSIRTLISRLSEDFLRDIDIDYRYEYYAYIDISSIGNKEDVDKLNLNLQYQLIMLSEIKHEKIIANIKKFLMLCEESLSSYYKDDRRNFVVNFHLALNRLKECILGYRELSREFSDIEKECEKDHDLQNTLWTLKRISTDFKRQLMILEKIQEVAEQSLQGNFQFYAENERMDSYFVLPFAKYINVLSMCNVMLGNTEQRWCSKKIVKNLNFFELDGNDIEGKYLRAYNLASKFHDPKNHLIEPLKTDENIVHQIPNGRGDYLKSSWKHDFDSILQNIREELKKDFNVEKHYIVRSVKQRTEEYNKEVQDFFEGMLRRKNSDMLVLIDRQEKSRTEGPENVTLLRQRIKYETRISKHYTKKEASNEDFKKGIYGEEELLKKMRDNFKERGEKLKKKILQIELTNEHFRQAFDVSKKEERVLLEELGKFSSINNVKLIHKILEQEEENRKLTDEIEKKTEEERFLNLTLFSQYEKMSSMFQEKINETENEIPGLEIEKERSFESSRKETDYQKLKHSEEYINRETSLKDEVNKVPMFKMDRKKTGIKSFKQCIGNQVFITSNGATKNKKVVGEFETQGKQRERNGNEEVMHEIEKASDDDTENKRSCEIFKTEQEKSNMVLEELRNLKHKIGNSNFLPS